MPGSALAFVLAAAAAQNPTAVREQPVDIIVTGERTPRSLRETPSSVVALTSDDIDASSGADRIDQILDLIPNVHISSGGEGPTIRGQDTTGASRDLYAFLGGTRPRTTLIVDGRPVSFNEFIFGAAPLWDVARVEVFRSPQTTTQGQNSIAGAIFVVTEDPAEEPEFRARGILGNLRTRQISAAASGPLTDGLALRVTGDYRSSRPASVIGENAIGANPNHDRYGLVRVKLTAKPAALPGSRFDLIYTHNQSQAPQIEGVSPPFENRRNPGAGYGTFRINTDTLTGRAQYETGRHLTLSALATVGDSDVQRFAPLGLGQAKLDNRDWFGEAIVNWAPPAGPIRATAGISHSRRKIGQYIDLSVLAGIGRFRDRQTSIGLFGEVVVNVLPRLQATAGLRYQRDAQRRVGTLGTSQSSISLDYDESFEAWLPKLSLSYDVSDTIRTGVLVQRAYNPGGVTLRFDTGLPDPFDDETLWDFELFAHASVRTNLKLSANLFTYRIADAQRAQPISIRAPSGQTVTFADLFNVPSARTIGLETEMDWQVSDRLRIRLGLGLLDTKILKTAAANAIFDGKDFGRAPEFSGSLAIEWRPVDRLRLSAQARRNSGYWSDDLNTPNRRVGGWTKIDARAEVDAGRFRLFGYARNLLDKFYLTYLFNPNLATAGDPREIGLGVEANF